MKYFKLTTLERDDLCIVIQHALESKFVCGMKLNEVDRASLDRLFNRLSTTEDERVAEGVE